MVHEHDAHTLRLIYCHLWLVTNVISGRFNTMLESFINILAIFYKHFWTPTLAGVNYTKIIADKPMCFSFIAPTMCIFTKSEAILKAVVKYRYLGAHKVQCFQLAGVSLAEIHPK